MKTATDYMDASLYALAGRHSFLDEATQSLLLLFPLQVLSQAPSHNIRPSGGEVFWYQIRITAVEAFQVRVGKPK